MTKGNGRRGVEGVLGDGRRQGRNSENGVVKTRVPGTSRRLSEWKVE